MPRALFEKTGNAIYISHLDLMRIFQRAFKRAGLPLTHTKGFNPRPSVSIALPLSLGVESVCELLDFDLEGDCVPDDITELVKNNSISAGHARALLGLNNRESAPALAQRIINKGLSVRATEEAVRSANKKEVDTHQKKSEQTSDITVDYISHLEKRITDKLGRRFKIHNGAKRKKIEIEFTDDADLESILTKLCGDQLYDD